MARHGIVFIFFVFVGCSFSLASSVSKNYTLTTFTLRLMDN